MDVTAWLSLGIFSVAIVVIILGIIDRSVTALVGVGLMVWAGVMTETEAFLYVDWNVMAILVSIWILAGYFGKSGIPEWLALRALRIARGHGGLLVLMLSLMAGLVSMLVDNVVVILMFAPVALPLVRHLGLPLTPVVLMIGFSANFMGTALLLGDLPPQMLHSVAGAEFLDFLWQRGRPSSFPILMLTFLLTLGGMYLYGFRRTGAAAARGPAAGSSGRDARVGALTAPAPVAAAESGDADPIMRGRIPDRLFAALSVGGLAVTVVAMAFREALDVKLGFIALTGALLLVVVMEILGSRVAKPEFETVLQELDWRAIIFYIGLFALVGGIEKVGILERLAHVMMPVFAENFAWGATLLYWITVPIVGVVEHDAYILAFLYTVRDLAQQGVDPWPLWWMLLWSGTLGSNLTVAGAPALYVALNICEREERRRVRVLEFLSWSVPFTLISGILCYGLGMLIWVLPS
jgi:Na+/H+ antiporter NhaD/arsenite permease-like protein